MKVSDFNHRWVRLHSNKQLADPLMLGALRLCVMWMWCVRTLDLAYFSKKAQRRLMVRLAQCALSKQSYVNYARE